MADDKPIIIIKKKGGHGGHHGGAWKVAYADFVTAMMAFFMVMWLVNSAESATKQSIASYFKNPGLFSSGSGTPLMIGQAGILNEAYTPPSHHHEKGHDKIPNQLPPQDVTRKEKFYPEQVGEQDKIENQIEKFTPATQKSEPVKELEQLAEEIKAELAEVPAVKDLLGDYEIKIESDGLSIEIMDTSKGSMFVAGSATITPAAQSAFYRIAEIIAKYPNRIDLIGHTDSKPFSQRPNGYSNWELSADRANSARRLLVQAGIKEDRLVSVVGRADRDLRDKVDPLNPSNRRITMKLRFKDTPNVPVKNLADELKKANEPKKQVVKPEEITAPKPKATPDPYANKHHLPWVTRKLQNVPAQIKQRETVKLEQPDTSGTPAAETRKKDKIFSNNPVIGPLNPLGAP